MKACGKAKKLNMSLNKTDNISLISDNHLRKKTELHKLSSKFLESCVPCPLPIVNKVYLKRLQHRWGRDAPWITASRGDVRMGRMHRNLKSPSLEICPVGGYLRASG